LTQDNATNSI